MSKKVATTTLRKLEKDSLKDKSKIIMFKDIELEIKQFIPIKDKTVFIELVKENSFDEDVYNPLFQSLAFDVFIVKYYTNINITDDLYEMYNLINSTGMIDIIKQEIPTKEICFLEEQCKKAIDYKNEQLNKGNTLVETIKHFLEGFSDKIPETLEVLKTFNPESYEYLNNAMKLNGLTENSTIETK